MIKPIFENIKSVLMSELITANASIWIASAYFSDSDIYKLLVTLSKRGIQVKIMVADEPINLFNENIDFQEIIDSGGAFILANRTNHNSLMHHKFCIIDDKKVITGSYNYTVKAATNNIENIVVIESDEVAQKYKVEFERIEEMFANNQYIWNEEIVFSGFLEIDRITKGFRPGELILIAGYSNIGHDLLAINIALETSKNLGTSTAFISTDQTNDQVVKRVISIESEVPLNKIRLAKLEDYEFNAVHIASESLKGIPLYFHDGNATIEETIKHCKLFKYKGVKLIVIDRIDCFLDLYGLNNSENSNKIVLDKLKKVARLIRLPIIVTTDLLLPTNKYRRNGQKPNINDLGILRDYCDTVIFLHRDEYYDILEDENGNSKRNVAEIIISKQFFNFTGENQMKFDNILGKFTSFETYEKPSERNIQEISSRPIISEDEPPF